MLTDREEVTFHHNQIIQWQEEATGVPSRFLLSFFDLALFYHRGDSHLATPDNLRPRAAPGHLAAQLRGLAGLHLDMGGHGSNLRPLWK